jgi:hypothetical protein|nr:MAG TPA: hypothetical protein [Ackermannviridae sp.]
MKLTKKDFYERINGKKVVIDNLEYIEKLKIDKDKKNLLLIYREGIFKDWKNRGYKVFYKVNKENITVCAYRNNNKKGALDVANANNFYARLIRLHSKNLKTIVNTKNIIINNVYFNKTDIEVLTENTFKTCNSECIYRILD